MEEMIEEGKKSAEQGENQRADLFGSLLKSTDVEDEKGGTSGMSDEELMGKPSYPARVHVPHLE
jgi:hypothetical protein